LLHLSKNQPESPVVEHLILLAKLIAVAYLASSVFFLQVWAENYNFIHTVLELFSLFLTIFTFLQVWNTYYETNSLIRWVGFAALIMVFLNMPHLINFDEVGSFPDILADYLLDVSLKHGVIIAFIELAVWLLLSMYRTGCSIRRWPGLLMSTIISVILLAVCMNIVEFIPRFMDTAYITEHKHAADYVSAIAAVIIAFLYWKKYIKCSDDREKVMYTYIILSLCLFAPARICFALSDTLASSTQFMGHIFKLAYRGMIYYGVYRATVEYPYTQVRRVKDFYKSLLDTAPIGIITINPEGTISYISKQCDTLFRHNTESLHGITKEELLENIEIEASERLEFLKKLNELEEGAFTFYGKPAFPGGQAGNLIFTVTKLPMGMSIVIRDAKKAQAIEHMQLQTQTVLDSTDNLIFILDNNRNVVMCNRKFLELSKMKARDIKGRNILAITELLGISLDDSIKVNGQNEKTTSSVSWNISAQDGEIKKISFESAPILDMDNEQIGWIIIGRDITDFEKEQEKIIHSEKMAVIGQMAAGLVHEIKNPLASIKGLCQLMQIKERPDKVPGYAAVIESAVNDISEIVNGFLQFSRPASGDFEITNINSLIASIEMLVSSNAYKHGIVTSFSYSEEDKPVYVSSQQIKNAVLGMADNAIDALKGAIDPKLEIATKYDKNTNTMNIVVKDNGIGMTEEQLACVGTPFYTTKPKGTGLGVSIFKYIANEHRGTLKIESSFGEGSVFTIELPVIPSD
jgi:PAS domain S-box-containing protein